MAPLSVDFGLSLLLNKFLLLFHSPLCDLILDYGKMLTLNILLNVLLLFKLLLKDCLSMSVVLSLLCVYHVLLHLIHYRDFTHMLVVNLLLLFKRRTL